MPNTKSAERRVRSSARKQLRNQSAKSRIKTLERRYTEALTEGNPENASNALRQVTSALDKAAKSKIIHRSMANRKKSRLAVRLSAASASS